MAKLLDTMYPFPTIESCGNDWDKFYKESENKLNEIPVEKLYSYPVADGQAFYYVVSLSPLVLQYIPYLDNYQLPYAHIRGLRRVDVEQYVLRNKRFGGIFGTEKIG
jgi:hypothetical protein